MSLIEVAKGNDRTVNVTVRDSAGAALNLTGAALEFSVKARRTDTAKVITKTIGSGITIVSAPLGTATIALADTDTSGLSTSPHYLWFLNLTDSSGNIYTVDDGRFVIVQGVTP